LVGSTNRLGALTEAQQSLYAHFATTCGLAPHEALSRLEQVIRAGVDSALLLNGISTAACTDLESTLEPHLNTLELESTWQQALSTCQELAYLLLNHYPDSLTDTQLEQLLTSDQPCAVVQTYLDSGRIQNNAGGLSITPTSQPEATADPLVSSTPTQVGPTQTTPTHTPTPEIPGIGTFLAREGNSESNRIYTFRDANQNPVTTLEEPQLNKLFPVYSPNGEFIAYLTEETSGNYALYKTEANPSGEERLCDTFNGLKVAPFPPAWTSDSEQLMFTMTDENGNYAIYSLNQSGSCQDQEPQLIIQDGHTPSFATDPAESLLLYPPLIAFVRDNQIWIYFTINGYEQQITTVENGQCSRAIYSTRSLTLYYQCQQDNQQTFYTYNKFGVQERVLEELQARYPDIRNFAPGPVDGYFAFDNGEDIYFGSEDDAELGVLSISGLSLSHLSWLPNSEN
jgi:hypothetical protein